MADSPERHTLTMEHVDPLGIQRWECSECEMVVFVRWYPDFVIVVDRDGDGSAQHGGCVGFEIGPCDGPDLGAEIAALKAEVELNLAAAKDELMRDAERDRLDEDFWSEALDDVLAGL